MSAFYVNDVHYATLKDTTFCNKNVNFRAEIENWESLKWYINGIEEIAAQNQLNWNKQFANGNYEIKMEIHYEKSAIKTLVAPLKVEAFWIKMRNVRY